MCWKCPHTSGWQYVARGVKTVWLFWPLKHFKGISRPEVGRGWWHSSWHRTRTAWSFSHNMHSDIPENRLQMYKLKKERQLVHSDKDKRCGRSSDCSPESVCELPEGHVCVLICSALLKGQGSGTVRLFTSMQKWMSISSPTTSGKLSLGSCTDILYRKQFASCMKRKSPTWVSNGSWSC